MRFLLDTNICIYVIKKKPIQLIEQICARNIGDIGLSSVTVAELEFRVAKSQAREKNQAALQQFLLPFELLPFDYECARVYGGIRAHLEHLGTPIGAMDTLIGAHARARGLILVTNNEREFARIPKLTVENWTQINAS